MRTFWLLLALVPFLLALAPGDSAPDFSAPNQDAKLVHLSDYRGKFVLLYFYPKDDTPGCTAEACSFRDHFAKLRRLNAVVFGISRQDAASHQEFAKKNHLPFDLLVDADAAIARSYGISLRPFVGHTERQSVLISPSGTVVRFYAAVNPATHVEEVMADIRKATPKK